MSVRWIWLSPFAPDVIARARELGLAEAHTAPFAEVAAAREAIYTHVWQPSPANPDMEREGVLRAQALAEMKIPEQILTEDVKVLFGQFVQQIFVNSGGARYLPPLSAERTLIEDFAEEEAAADAPSKLLEALGLAKRSALSRTGIETALVRSGDEILEKRLGLDPLEFRLVCIPYDLYLRFGRDRGFGTMAALDSFRWLSGHGRQPVAGAGRRGWAVWRAQRSRQHQPERRPRRRLRALRGGAARAHGRTVEMRVEGRVSREKQ